MHLREPSRDESELELLTLRRILWNVLAGGCLASSVVLALGPDGHPPVTAVWCVLIPLAALATHYRAHLYQRIWHATRSFAAADSGVVPLPVRAGRRSRQGMRDRRRGAMARRVLPLRRHAR